MSFFARSEAQFRQKTLCKENERFLCGGQIDPERFTEQGLYPKPTVSVQMPPLVQLGLVYDQVPPYELSSILRRFLSPVSTLFSRSSSPARKFLACVLTVSIREAIASRRCFFCFQIIT